MTYQNEQARLSFAQAHKNYAFLLTLFADETVFRIGQPHYGYSPKGVYIYRTSHKYPPQTGVWAYIDREGKGNLTFYEGSLNQYSYQKILDEFLYPTANGKYGLKRWSLVHDGATCHTANSTKQAILAQARRIIDWPAASPDLNPIENVWALLKRAVNRKNPSSKQELKNIIQDEWNKLDNSIVQGLARSMPARLNKLLETKGAYTGY